MKDLTITQEYLICAVNEKGKISGFSTEKLVCFVAAGLLELQLEKCISIDKKKVSVIGELPADKMHLKPLYEFIKPKPVKMENILEAYNYSLTDKRLNELMESVGVALIDMGLVESEKTGVFGNKKSYIPKKEAINRVIDMVRAELLEDGDVTEDIVALVILLDKSKTLKRYFSEFEQRELKNKLKEIVNSTNGKMVKDMVAYVENIITIMTVIVVTQS